MYPEPTWCEWKLHKKPKQQIQPQQLQKKDKTSTDIHQQMGKRFKKKRAGRYKTNKQTNKKDLDKLGREREGPLEWLRGQLNCDGERIIIHAQNQGLYMNGF